MRTFALILLLIFGIAIGVAISIFLVNQIGLSKLSKEERRKLKTSDPDKSSQENAASGQQRLWGSDISVEQEVVLLNQTLDSIPQGIVICSVEGEILFRNKVAKGLFDGRHQDALAARALDELLTLAKAGTMTERSLEVYGPPKKSYVLHTDALKDNQQVVGVIAVLEDISEKKHLDEVRRDFVANVSHELKTPIGAIGLLAETLYSEDDFEIAKRLSVRIQNEAFRVGRIIDDLLDLSRIEAEDTPIQEIVEIEKVVAEAVNRMSPSAEVRLVTIELSDTETESPSYVLGDRRQLTSAVYNLLDNAVKYSESDSKVTIQIDRNGSWVDISVRDQGIGIPSRDLERIFERFYRVDQARSRSTGGTGLGLSIVRHVVNNHKGNIFVESREGSGSTFTLHLPLAESVRP